MTQRFLRKHRQRWRFWPVREIMVADRPGLLGRQSEAASIALLGFTYGGTEESNSSLLCQLTKRLNGLFHAGRPRMAATDTHTITKVFSVRGENASWRNGDPVLVEGADGKLSGVQF